MLPDGIRTRVPEIDLAEKALFGRSYTIKTDFNLL
jgi:hypothetical protein